MIYQSQSPKDTQNIASKLAQNIETFKTKGAKVIALEGELGAGKTVFVKGLAKALKIKEKIKSPTFVLIRVYAIGKTNNFIYHLDCYRLKDEKDLEILGIKEILNTQNNIVLIEWPERVKKILPKKYIRVRIDHVSDTERKITIK